MEQSGKYFINDYELSHMSSYSNYPQSLLNAMQVKSLIGPRGDIAEQDISVSAFQLDPGTDYRDHAHAHPADDPVSNREILRVAGRTHRELG